MEKNVWIFSDFVGYGNVAMATTRAILTRMGCTVFCLPTALISNTWNFGRCAQLDTTDYLKASLENWEALGFRPDAVLLGYLADEAQARWLSERCRAWKQAGAQIFLDPVFADNGRLYRGIGQGYLSLLRQLLPLADYTLPNATEAAFLTGAQTPESALAALDCPNALITGAEGRVLVRTGKTTCTLPYEAVPGSFPGAGDAFTALFLGAVLSGMDTPSAAGYAVQETGRYLLSQHAEHWPGMGLPVERYF